MEIDTAASPRMMLSKRASARHVYFCRLRLPLHSHITYIFSS
jgi:hypothetical protein